MKHLEPLLNIAEDITYSFTCWLSSKSEVFNLFFGSFFTVFFIGMIFVVLMLPQINQS